MSRRQSPRPRKEVLSPAPQQLERPRPLLWPELWPQKLERPMPAAQLLERPRPLPRHTPLPQTQSRWSGRSRSSRAPLQLLVEGILQQQV